MELFLLISCFLFTNSIDTSFSSILKRVSLRDSTTNAIIAVKFPDGVEKDICHATNMNFSISMVDSQKFSVSLSPRYSGYVGGCEPSDLFEEYHFAYSNDIYTEYSKHQEYTKMRGVLYEKKGKEIQSKVLQLTNYQFKYRTPMCEVIDSLGENCVVNYIDICDTILGLYEGGYTLKYQDFTLVFTCNRAYCFLKDIYTNAEFKKNKSCIFIEKRSSPSLNIIKRHCNTIKKNSLKKTE